MQRCVYRMQSGEKYIESAIAAFTGKKEKLQSYISKGEIMTISVFRHGFNFFVYYECIGRTMICILQILAEI